MMQASKKVPFEDPNVLNIVRGVYILSNLIIAGIFIYIQTKINAKKGEYCIYFTHGYAGDTSRAAGNCIYASRRRISSHHIDHTTKTDLAPHRHDRPQIRRTSTHGLH